MENQETMGTDLSELMAGTLLGVVNQVIETAARPLVGVKIAPEVRKYEEVVELIEEQNGKNINRLKLDEEDRALLRPLIAAVVRKSGKTPSPEQQLVAVAAVILLKKGQLAMQIREENKSLMENLLEIVRREGAPMPTDAGTTGAEDTEMEENESEQVAERVAEEETMEAEELSEDELAVLFSGNPPSIADFATAGIVEEGDDDQTILRKLGEWVSEKGDEGEDDESDLRPVLEENPIPAEEGSDKAAGDDGGGAPSS